MQALNVEVAIRIIFRQLVFKTYSMNIPIYYEEECISGPEVIKPFFLLNSTEHEINVKMPTIALC